MPQLELFHIPSPCKGICQNNANGFCKGCFRSRDERFNWLHFSDEDKRHIIRLCKSRKYRLVKKQMEIEAVKPSTEQQPLSSTGDLFD